ncbi:MAG: sulfite exporter TauE/SafE family protein [Spirochaetaceae bacterium]|nr:MAG: sulfite exporter TauE/SafE family protein [Spirochaetaceae bacterium]
MVLALYLAAVSAWGVAVGLVVGFTAIGTGLLGTPGLIILFGMDAVTAVGTMAVAGVAMMTNGAVAHYRNGNVEPRIAFLFSITAIPTTYIAASYARRINSIVPLETVIAVVILISVVLLFHRYMILRPAPRPLKVRRVHLAGAALVGAVIGVLMGATSISGSVIVISFIILLKLPSPHAIGTTSVVSAISLAIASVAHIQSGNVDWFVLSALVPGVLLGSLVGARYVNRVPRDLLRIGILLILLAAAVVMVVN